MSIRRLLRSFRDACRGLRFAFLHEQNFRIQLFLALVVVVLTFVFSLKVWEIILLILLIMTVLTVELLNTSLEYFADLLKPRLSHYVSVIKDIMAAAVLISSLGASAIGLIIFLPHFIGLLK
ncbi:MAG: diacylglycerol kinase [Candidatus Magasanikbacteria bacterium]|nr:diacylglycerol kinase [Candidatus Magasanikbacteria bacterium]